MIAVDIGNTSLHFAWQKDSRIIRTVTLPTPKATIASIGKIVRKSGDEKIFICSVVPSVTKLFKKVERKVYVIGEEVRVPIKCFYVRKKVGVDRLVAAFAAKTFYPDTRIIIDFGTAITFDILSRSGAYEGGLILPGIGSTLKVLSSCALLPKKIKIYKTTRLIPRNTRESIAKGIEEGFSAMVNILVEKYKKKLKLSRKEIIMLTGGDACHILPALNFSYNYEPALVLKGIFLLGQSFTPSR